MVRKVPTQKILLLLLFTLLAACGPSEEEIATQTAAAWTPTPTKTNTPPPTPTPLPPTETPTPEPSLTPQPVGDAPPIEEILELTNTSMAAAESYHFELVASLETLMSGIPLNIPLTFSGDFLAPDNMQGTLSIYLFGTVTETQFVTIGDLAYSTDVETGEWVQDAESLLPFDPNDFVGSFQIELTDPQLIGIEDVDGIQAYHLVGVIPSDNLGEDFAGADSEVQGEYWIGVDNHLIYRLTMVLSLISELIEGSGESELKINVELTLSDYGKEVVIESPVD